jgi:hypothetical protein
VQCNSSATVKSPTLFVLLIWNGETIRLEKLFKSLNKPERVLRLSQRCSWGLPTPAMQLRVTGWLMPAGSRQCNGHIMEWNVVNHYPIHAAQHLRPVVSDHNQSGIATALQYAYTHACLLILVQILWKSKCSVYNDIDMALSGNCTVF